MNQFWKKVLITIAIIYGITLVAAFISGYEVFLFVPLALALFGFFFGLIFLAAKESRELGKTMIAASGIVLLIGISVCSIYPIRI